MFTGIIELDAAVAAVEDRPGGRRIRIATSLPCGESLAVGESIAVNGACLTLVEWKPREGGVECSFDVVPETLRLTTLGSLGAGDPVNLERSLSLGDRLGGHFVTGHVDGTGTVRGREPEGDQILFEIALAPELLRQVIRKGSVAIDGVSLTVVDVSRASGSFRFAAIPHTLRKTTLGARAPGSPVNVETDLLGKWVLHALEERGWP
jgi:riboflavin synthase